MIANLDFDTVWNTLALQGDNRAVGNRIYGMHGPKFGSGTGTVTAGGESIGGAILGNIIHGGESNWRFDHAIYLSDCPSERGWTVAWNYVYGNNFARGPQVIINHQSPRCGTGAENKSLASHFVRNNTIDTSNYRGRCLGINSFGWDPEANPEEPGWSYMDNNDLIECGFEGNETDSFGDGRNGPAIQISRGGVFIRHNRLYASEVEMQVGTSNSADFQGAVISSNLVDNVAGQAIVIGDGVTDKVMLTDNTDFEMNPLN